jgi:small conductance mechanosensitive channel
MDEIIIQLKSYVTSYGVNILIALLILIIGLWAAKLITNFIKKILSKRNVDETLNKFVGSLTKTILITFVVIAAVNKLGIETTSFVAVLGAAVFAIGFALQGSLSNFAAGVMLIIFRPVKVGDFIEAGGASGSVNEIGIFSSILTTPDNKVIYVPNSKIISDNIVNYSAKDTRRVDMIFGISYTDDIDKAKSIIKSILDNNDKVMKEPAPLLVLSELAEVVLTLKLHHG